jgi:hypothetical protein
VANGERLLRWPVCHGFATFGIKPAHRLLQAHLGRVQVRRGLREIRVSKHLLT